MAGNPRLASHGGVGWNLLLIFVCGLVPGCMSQQLRSTAQRTVNTIPDLHYQQVIDNLAKIASNPGYLPYLAVAGQGSVQVTDNGSSALAVNMSPGVLGAGILSLGASRNVTGTWTLGTITSPEKIRGMQAVYVRAIRGRAAGDPAFWWLKIGGKKDVPEQTSYAGSFGDVWVWVMPDGIEGLSDLSLAIMDVASREDAGDAKGEHVGSVSEMTGPPGPTRRNFQVSPVGPVFTPGAH